MHLILEAFSLPRPPPALCSRTSEDALACEPEPSSDECPATRPSSTNNTSPGCFIGGSLDVMLKDCSLLPKARVEAEALLDMTSSVSPRASSWRPVNNSSIWLALKLVFWEKLLTRLSKPARSSTLFSLMSYVATCHPSEGVDEAAPWSSLVSQAANCLLPGDTSPGVSSSPSLDGSLFFLLSPLLEASETNCEAANKSRLTRVGLVDAKNMPP
mmetsp:Transcript_18995/g.44653  ORF Transcript_18995/g.44653 Transcript_18995/m.44653 type:complete len:214 (+) Transcript_18995:389-1030(+)